MGEIDKTFCSCLLVYNDCFLADFKTISKYFSIDLTIYKPTAVTEICT